VSSLSLRAFSASTASSWLCTSACRLTPSCSIARRFSMAFSSVTFFDSCSSDRACLRFASLAVFMALSDESWPLRSTSVCWRACLRDSSCFLSSASRLLLASLVLATADSSSAFELTRSDRKEADNSSTSRCLTPTAACNCFSMVASLMAASSCSCLISSVSLVSISFLEISRAAS